jgi:hypothetical protein
LLIFFQIIKLKNLRNIHTVSILIYKWVIIYWKIGLINFQKVYMVIIKPKIDEKDIFQGLESLINSKYKSCKFKVS